MEEYLDGVVHSYDAIVDGNGEPVFETGLVEMGDLMDIVNSNDNSCYYYLNNPLDDVRDAGRRTLKAFGVKTGSCTSSFPTFPRPAYRQEGRNRRVRGKYATRRRVLARYDELCQQHRRIQIWADTLVYGSTLVEPQEKFYCAYAGRRNGKNFTYSEQDIVDRYRNNLKQIWHVPTRFRTVWGT